MEDRTEGATPNWPRLTVFGRSDTPLSYKRSPGKIAVEDMIHTVSSISHAGEISKVQLTLKQTSLRRGLHAAEASLTLLKLEYGNGYRGY